MKRAVKLPEKEQEPSERPKHPNNVKSVSGGTERECEYVGCVKRTCRVLKRQERVKRQLKEQEPLIEHPCSAEGILRIFLIAELDNRPQEYQCKKYERMRQLQCEQHIKKTTVSLLSVQVTKKTHRLSMRDENPADRVETCLESFPLHSPNQRLYTANLA